MKQSPFIISLILTRLGYWKDNADLIIRIMIPYFVLNGSVMIDFSIRGKGHRSRNENF